MNSLNLTILHNNNNNADNQIKTPNRSVVSLGILLKVGGSPLNIVQYRPTPINDTKYNPIPPKKHETGE